MEFILALIVAGGIGYWTYTRINRQIEQNHPETPAASTKPVAESTVEPAAEQPAAKPKKSSARKTKPKAE
jgi:hypothetical protein